MSDDPAPHLPIRDIPPAEPASPPRPRPRLSIAHLMLWTLGTAIVLATSRGQLSAFDMHQFKQQTSSGSLGTFYRVLVMVTSPFIGLAVAMLLLVLWRLYRRQHLPLTQPGHWILLILGALFGLRSVANLLSLLDFNEPFGRELIVTWLLIFAAQAIIWGSIAALCWIAWRRTPGETHWRFAFATNFVFCVYMCVAGVLAVSSTMLGAIMMIVMVPVMIAAIPIGLAWLIAFPSAVIQDLWFREHRDPLHWAGVALVVVNVVSTIATGLAEFIIPHR